MKLDIRFDKLVLPVNYDKLTASQRRETREEYVRIQNNLCLYCNQSLDKVPTMLKEINRSLFPPNFFKYPVHLHHDHNTGMTIGAVHNYCNAVLWQYHGE